jgi:hypothetical protein
MKAGLRFRQTDSVAAAAETELGCFSSGNLSNQADIQCKIDANFHANRGDHQNYSCELLAGQWSLKLNLMNTAEQLRYWWW